ncbi:MAG: hypothetical protein ACI8PZ_001340 [Myxococcota bacterium]|jgi:hypothetical protein
MASIITLCLLIAAMYVVVVAGAVAFELTGLDADMARFQALSCFTGTGFTTRASEGVVENRLRRRIASVLIVLGYAGAASVIATAMQSFNVEGWGASLRNVALAVVGGLITFELIRRRRDRIVVWLRTRLTLHLTGDLLEQETLFRAGPGMGVVRIRVPPGCPLAGVPLSELNLSSSGIVVLLFEHDDKTYDPARGDSVLEEGAHVLVFGTFDVVRAAFNGPATPSAERST